MPDTPHPSPLLIGVTSAHGDAEWLSKNTHHYLDFLAQAGAQAVVLTPDTPAVFPDGSSYAPDSDGRLPDTILDHLHGLVASGGGDVHPKHFGQEPDGAEPKHISLGRDELELNLLRTALQRDLPVFGICRGCQVLNVAGGGSLRQHFDGHRSSAGQTAYHRVDLQPNTNLQRMVGAEAMQVNTFHHQGINRSDLAPGFFASAFAHPDDWLVEAIESLRHRWALGVQWHPERIFELEPSHRLIWDSFLTACRATRVVERA